MYSNNILKYRKISQCRKMAAKEGVPPDKVENKTCCKTNFAAVVCLFCDKL